MPSNFNSKVVTQGLHRLDRAGFDRLLAEAPPATQEWLAINDRMRRAAQSTVKENTVLEGDHP